MQVYKATPVVEDVWPLDVLLGRGKSIHMHHGNIEFRRLIKERSIRYATNTAINGRDDLAWEVIDAIEDMGGRFLRPIHNSANWEKCPHAIVRTKVKQALRDTEKIRARRGTSKSSPPPNFQQEAMQLPSHRNGSQLSCSSNDHYCTSNTAELQLNSPAESSGDIIDLHLQGPHDESRVHLSSSRELHPQHSQHRRTRPAVESRQGGFQSRGKRENDSFCLPNTHDSPSQRLSKSPGESFEARRLQKPRVQHKSRVQRIKGTYYLTGTGELQPCPGPNNHQESVEATTQLESKMYDRLKTPQSRPQKQRPSRPIREAMQSPTSRRESITPHLNGNEDIVDTRHGQPQSSPAATIETRPRQGPSPQQESTTPRSSHVYYLSVAEQGQPQQRVNRPGELEGVRPTQLQRAIYSSRAPRPKADQCYATTATHERPQKRQRIPLESSQARSFLLSSRRHKYSRVPQPNRYCLSRDKQQLQRRPITTDLTEEAEQQQHVVKVATPPSHAVHTRTTVHTYPRGPVKLRPVPSPQQQQSTNTAHLNSPVLAGSQRKRHLMKIHQPPNSNTHLEPSVAWQQAHIASISTTTTHPVTPPKADMKLSRQHQHAESHHHDYQQQQQPRRSYEPDVKKEMKEDEQQSLSRQRYLPCIPQLDTSSQVPEPQLDAVSQAPSSDSEGLHVEDLANIDIDGLAHFLLRRSRSKSSSTA